MARHVSDITAVLDPIFVRGKKERRPQTIAKPSSLRGFRLGVYEDFFLNIVSAKVEQAFQSALHVFRKLGADVKEVSIPLLNETEDAGNQIAWAEATLYHQQAGWFPARSAEYGEDVRTRLELGAKVAATRYLHALEQREYFIASFHLTMAEAKLDALLAPTTPISAPAIGEESTPICGTNHPTRALLLRNNRPANLAGLPAMSVPCGFTLEGLPVGLQLIAAASDEDLLLRIAHAFEQATDYHLRRARIALEP